MSCQAYSAVAAGYMFFLKAARGLIYATNSESDMIDNGLHICQRCCIRLTVVEGNLTISSALLSFVTSEPYCEKNNKYVHYFAWSAYMLYNYSELYKLQ